MRGRAPVRLATTCVVAWGLATAPHRLGAEARPFPTWLGERAAARPPLPEAASNLGPAQPALQAVLETPHDCRLSNFHPSVQDFVALRLPRYRTVRWNQNGSEPRLVFVKDGLITGILYLEANADNLEDVLQAHGIFPSR